MSDNNRDTNKWSCVIAYIGILFFVPLLVDQKNKFNRFHANQALVLLIFAAIVNLIGNYMTTLIGSLIWLVGGIMMLVFMIMGVLNAANEKMKPLPLIGKIKLIK